MSDDLDQIERLASTLLRRVGGAERRRILRRVAGEIRVIQSARIAAQKDPDGSAYEKRKARPAPVRGTYAVRFLYPKGAAEPRLVFMKSWVRQGPLLTGYDVEAGGIRSFFWDHVAKWLPIDAAEQNAGAGKYRRQGKLRQQAMFRRLRTGRYLRAGSTEDEAWIGFTGPAAGIAAIHQTGGTDKASKSGKPVRYARRVLLGLSNAERALLVDCILEHLSR